MPPTRRLLAIAVVMSLAATPHASAQSVPVAGEVPAFRTEHLVLVPAAIGSGGYDTNIHSEGPPAGPIAAPEIFGAGAMSLFANASAMELNASSGAELVSFTDHPGEGGLSWAHRASVRLPFAKFRPKGSLRYADTYARPTGFEIGARSRHQEFTFGGGLDVRLSPRATLGGEVTHLSTNYAADAIYQNSPLYDTLSLDLLVASANFSYDVSTLTTVTFAASQDRTRFRRLSQRDTDGGVLLAGFEMNRPALISGSARLGLRWFKPLDRGVNSFVGLTGNANLVYLRPSGFSVGVAFNRDTQFSYTQTLAYYLLTDVGGRVSYSPHGWKLGAGGSYRWLDYTHAGTLAGMGRIDHFYALGGMVGHKVGRGMELGVNGDYLNKSGALSFTGARLMAFWSLGTPFLMRFDRPLPGEIP
jgi:hypothetical protein